VTAVLATLDIGDRRRFRATFRASDGITTDTTVAVKILAPDGTSTSPTPVSDGAGVYHHDMTFTMAGRWVIRWTGTGAVVTSEERYIDVRRRAAP